MRHRETLRKDNLVVNLIRAAAQDLELGGHRVDAGTLLAVPLTYLTANDPRYSERREEFWPERMLRDDTKKQGEHMPFGAGNRCAGLVQVPGFRLGPALSSSCVGKGAKWPLGRAKVLPS
jgi:cytochrome P450